MSRRTRIAVILSLVIWAMCVLAWTGLLATERFVGCPSFAPADSDFGEQLWVWTPPGNRCTWQLAEGRHTEDPPTARYGILGLLVLWPASTWAIARVARSEGK
jgi:hypothetical protein